jgi:hypothetical protein
VADTKWCPNCGAEYREGVDTCADCGVALVDEPPAAPAEDEGTEVVVYELADWSEDQRGELEQRLEGEAVAHQWELAEGATVDPAFEGGHPWVLATDLVVGEQDEEVVDRLLDEIDHPDELTAVESDGTTDGESAADDDEARYNVMSHLYVAADRLKDDPGDLALAGELFDSADAARSIDVPFGIDGDVWNKVLELAAAVTVALEEEADDDVVAARAKELRDLLFTFV